MIKIVLKVAAIVVAVLFGVYGYYDMRQLHKEVAAVSAVNPEVIDQKIAAAIAPVNALIVASNKKVEEGFKQMNEILSRGLSAYKEGETVERLGKLPAGGVENLVTNQKLTLRSPEPASNGFTAEENKRILEIGFVKFLEERNNPQVTQVLVEKLVVVREHDGDWQRRTPCEPVQYYQNRSMLSGFREICEGLSIGVSGGGRVGNGYIGGGIGYNNGCYPPPRPHCALPPPRCYPTGCYPAGGYPIGNGGGYGPMSYPAGGYGSYPGNNGYSSNSYTNAPTYVKNVEINKSVEINKTYVGRTVMDSNNNNSIHQYQPIRNNGNNYSSGNSRVGNSHPVSISRR